MKKRVTTALLAACIAASLSLPCYAATGTIPPVSEVTQVVQALGIMNGDATGAMNLDAQVTRAEFITIALKASVNGAQIGEASTSPFPDVPYTHWAAGFVETGVKAGLISGFSDGTFRPNAPINLAEGVTVALALLGYTSSDFSGAYPSPQMSLYRSLSLDKGVSAKVSSDPLTRQDAMYLFYNLLSAKTKAGQPYINTLGYQLNASGEVDLVSIINGEMQGPIVATGSWKSSVPFDLSNATVIRNGSASSLGQIQDMDILYWNDTMNTIWAYSEKLTGTIQDIQPSSSNPTSVTVSGHTLNFETVSAAYALSDLGSFGLGDTVTLLLGRDGAIAHVISPSETEADRCGIVIKTEKATYPDGHGSTYMGETITILATDGNTYSYEAPIGYFKAGDFVGANIGADGEITLRRPASPQLSGTVSKDGTKIDNLSFADDIEILEASDSSAVSIYPSRLAGMKLESSSILYYELNGRGEISRLVLRNATGDARTYALMTVVGQTQMGELSRFYTYKYDINGSPYVISDTTKHYPVSRGGVIIEGDPSNPDRMIAMNSVKATQIQGNQLLVGNKTYTISEQVIVYEHHDDVYTLSTLDRVQDLGLSLTGWYDKDESEGGRIRIIVAE